MLRLVTLTSKYTPLLTFILGTLLGLGGGWFRRDGSEPPPTGSTSTRDVPGQSASTSWPMAKQPSLVPGSHLGETAFATALRLLDGRFDTPGDTVAKFQFQQAIAQCGVEDLQQIVAHLRRTTLARVATGEDSTTVEWNSILVLRLIALSFEAGWAAIVSLEEASIGILDADYPTLFGILLQSSSVAQVQQRIAALPEGLLHTAMDSAWLIFRADVSADDVIDRLANAEDPFTHTVKADTESYTSLLERLAVTAPARTLALLQVTPEMRKAGEGYDADEARHEIFRKWLQRDVEGACRHAMNQRDPELLNLCLDAGEKSVLDQPTLRAAVLEMNGASESDSLELISRLARDFASEDRDGSRAWAATLPDTQQKQANLAILHGWLSKDLTGASQWVSSWPASESRNEAVLAVARHLRKDDPLASLAWAQSIPASEKRFKAIWGTLEDLSKGNPDEAARAVTTLSPEDQVFYQAVLSWEQNKAVPQTK